MSGNGNSEASAVLQINFETADGLFTAPLLGNNKAIRAPVNIELATGEFSGDDLIISYSDNIFTPELAYGEIKGHLTGENQDGAVGAIWSDQDEYQLFGVFGLRYHSDRCSDC